MRYSFDPMFGCSGVIDLLLFDNVQKKVQLVTITYPHITFAHGDKHVVPFSLTD
jgi:hypothetical protein